MAKKSKILVQVVGATPDPTQYKPLNPEFKFDNLYIEVPAEGKEDGADIILQPAAFEDLLGELALISAHGYDRYTERRQE